MSSVKIRDPRDILLAPVVSEIKIAVETVFKVQVTNVNTLNRPGKKRRTRYGFGKRPDTKRAIVTVAPGERIDIFSSPGS
jgi:large subunit ribosomal protein L23